MIYIFLGPPASGKGTQAELLSEALHIPTVSVGSVLREMSEYIPEIKEVQNRGDIVSNEYIQKVYLKLSKQFPDDVIIDGAMRTVDQVNIVCSLWPPEKIVVIWIEVSDSVIKDRTEERILSNGTKRSDDRRIVTENRIVLYRMSIDAVLGAINQHNLLRVKVNGNESIEVIHETIMDQLKTYDLAT